MPCRLQEMHRQLPTTGVAHIRSRVVGIHSRPKGSSFVEYETLVSDSAGQLYCRLVTGQYRRGVNQLGDIEPFEGVGTTYSAKLAFPARPPDVTCEQWIADNQALIYRLSGDFNPLHIDVEAAKLGGFDRPILHGLCTFGHCASMLLGALCGGDPSRFRSIKVRFSSPASQLSSETGRSGEPAVVLCFGSCQLQVFMNSRLRMNAWHDGPGRVLFNAEVDGRRGDSVLGCRLSPKDVVAGWWWPMPISSSMKPLALSSMKPLAFPSCKKEAWLLASHVLLESWPWVPCFMAVILAEASDLTHVHHRAGSQLQGCRR